MKQICIILIFLTTYTVSWGQRQDFHKGYIVTLNGDSLSGWVKDRSSDAFGGLLAKIHFQPEGKRRKKKFGPNDIASYGYGESEFIVLPLRFSQEFFKLRYSIDNDNGENTFLKVIRRDDRLIYYHMEFEHDDNDYIDFVPLFLIPGKQDLVRVTQGILGLKKKRLAEYFNTCPDLIYALENDKLKDIDEVFNFYLNICEQ